MECAHLGDPLPPRLSSIYPDCHDIQVITLAQDWIATNVTPPVEVVGSLASEMIKRASEEEQVGVQLECVIFQGLLTPSGEEAT
jgi:hypothetical protein